MSIARDEQMAYADTYDTEGTFIMPYHMTALVRVLPVVKSRIREMNAEDIASRIVREKGYCENIHCDECIFEIQGSHLCVNHRLFSHPDECSPNDSAKSRLYILTLLKVQP